MFYDPLTQLHSRGRHKLIGGGTQEAVDIGKGRGGTWIGKSGVSFEGDDGVDTTQRMVTTGGSSQAAESQSTQFTPVVPPVLDLLAEMRARREAERTMAASIVGALMQAAPMAVPEGSGGVFPGFEKGGIADVLMGIISGKGTQAGGGIMGGLRKPGTMTLPISAMQVAEPSVGEEFGGALGLSQQILDALRIVQTGQATSTSTGGGFTQAPLEEGGVGMEEVLIGLILQTLMGQGQPGVAQGTQPQPSGYNPDTGDIYTPGGLTPEQERQLQQIGVGTGVR